MGATFQQIRELQVLTGRSLKECKEALNNHGCDLEAAAKSLAGSTAAAGATAATAATAVATATVAAAVAAATLAFATATAGRAAEELDGVCDDIGRILLHALFVGVFAGLDAALDVDATTLLEVLRGVLALASPDNHAVPLGALLLVAGLVDPGVGGGHIEGCDALPTLGGTKLGVAPQITNDHDLVERCRHDDLHTDLPLR
jgi:hypothetical protein